MKKTYNAVAAMVIFAVFALMAVLVPLASAEDKILERKIDNIVFKKDKNGQQYARIFVTEVADIGGVKYPKSVSVMAFGDAAAEAKTLKKGNTLKAVVSEQDFRGTRSYLLLKVL